VKRSGWSPTLATSNLTLTRFYGVDKSRSQVGGGSSIGLMIA